MPLEIDAEIFRAVVSTIVPESVDLDSQGWRDLDLVVEGLLRDRPENLQGQLRLFLRFIQWLPVLRFGRPFTSLSTLILKYSDVFIAWKVAQTSTRLVLGGIPCHVHALFVSFLRPRSGKN